ncbi:MAG: M50 family metallopeptidase [Gemmatimonadota bacterium]
MKDRTRGKIRFLAGFGAYFGTVWLLWNTPVVLPLKLFVVLLHEASHGLVALATGGQILEIVITADEGGRCVCPGGSRFLTLSAGYLGSLGWGALILWAAARGAAWSRWTSGTIGVGLGALSLLYLRNPFGLLFGLAAGGALLFVGWKLSSRTNLILLTLLGLTSCLYAVLDIKSDILDRPEALSDAAMLAAFTGIPTLLWGIAWIAVALWVSWRLLRRAYRRA